MPVSTPNTPTLVIVNVPPDMSAGGVLPAFAVCTRAVSASASSRSDSRPASLMFGTISPRSVAAAMPRLTYSLTTISCRPAQVELTIGCRLIASSTALADQQQRRDPHVAPLRQRAQPVQRLASCGSRRR